MAKEVSVSVEIDTKALNSVARESAIIALTTVVEEMDRKQKMVSNEEEYEILDTLKKWILNKISVL